MGSLRSEAQEAKGRIDSQRASEMARQQATEQREREERERIDAEARQNTEETKERAAEFLTIMREYDAPLVGYYSGVWTGVGSERRSRWDPAPESYSYRPNDGETGRWNEQKFTPQVDLRISPIMGWLAMRPYRMSVPDAVQHDPVPMSHRVTLPGVFVDQDGYAYPCSDEIRVRGQLGVTNNGEFGKTVDTLLGGELALSRIAARLAINGYV